MQETAKLKLKKPGVNDYVNIEDLNDNMDIIEQFLSAWKEFKEAGGVINGPIDLKNQALIESYANGISFMKKGVDKSKVQVLSTDILNMLAPTNTNAMDLGGEFNTWRDLFLSGVGATQNGYIKLPNGFILQWGLTEIPIPSTGDRESLSQDIIMPVTFPTKGIVAWSQVVNLTSLTGGAYKASFFNLIPNLKDRSTIWLYARTSNANILTPTDTALKAYWFALGH